MRVAVVGAGVFGAAAALELAARGHAVSLHDPGPLPHPDAASTDISKLVRPDYGADALYRDWMLACLQGWRAWNERFERPLFHEVGLRVIGDVAPGTFEGDSLAALRQAGVPVDLEPGGYVDRWAGWAESGEVVRALVGWCRDAGVQLVEERVTEPEAVSADTVVVAAGAWTPALMPELADRIGVVGQPVLHFRPDDPEAFRPPRFLPWCYDIANTGFYGFPATPDGIVKVANHGPGTVVDPSGPRGVDARWEPRFRAFLREHLPALADAPLAGTRLCLYSDSFDGDFFVDRVPGRPRVVVASGGSGHGFKFAPGLGALIADVVQGTPPAWASRFRWRERGERRTEAARFDG